MKLTKKQELRNELAKLGIESYKSWTIEKLEMILKKELKVIRGICVEAIERSEKYRNCYFWQSPSNASSRRRMEFDDDYEFTFNGVEICVKQSLSCSCRNVYFYSAITHTGNNSNITYLKGIVKKIDVKLSELVN